MGLSLQTITLNTPHLNEVLLFWKALGVDFHATAVKSGGQIYKSKIGSIEFNLVSIPKGSPMPSPEVSFRIQVQNIESKVEALKKSQNVRVMMDVEELFDGKTAIVLDPDGRSFELLEG